MGFDAWGQRRDADAWHPWQQPPAMYLNAMLAITPRGFTGHEHVDTAGIIHMNGRIYDPRLGRFLQADPFVEDTTTLNRYTYVHNNPLAYTDPSGYFSVGKFFKRNWRTIATIAVSVFAPYAGLGFWGTVGLGAGAGFITTGTIEGALIGAFTAGAFYGIGQYYQAAAQANAQFAELGWLNPSILNAGGLTTGQAAMQALSHSLAGGTISTLQGGKFGHGFLSAGITKVSSPGIGRIGDPALQTAAAAVVGGTISRITGGKFANGAVTAAMAYAFNQCASGGCTRQERAQERANEIAQDITDRGYFEGKGEADWLYQLNSDPNLAVTVDASRLTVTASGKWVPEPGGGYRAPGHVKDAYAVHGQVSIRHRPDGTYGLYDETYDFGMHRDMSPRGIARNVGAISGGPPGGWFSTPYKIQFRGNTYITNPRVP